MNIQALEKEIKKLKDKIAGIDAKLEALNSEKSGLSNQLIGLETAHKLLTKPTSVASSHKHQELRPDSEIAKVRDILQNAQKPMHIDEILRLLGYENDQKKKLSLAGSLGSYVSAGRIFKRIAPNTFSLLETGQNMDDSDDIEKQP